MSNIEPRIEVYERFKTSDGTLAVGVVVNGFCCDTPIRVATSLAEASMKQIESLVREVYLRGQRDGAESVRKAMKDVLWVKS